MPMLNDVEVYWDEIHKTLAFNYMNTEHIRLGGALPLANLLETRSRLCSRN